MSGGEAAIGPAVQLLDAITGVVRKRTPMARETKTLLVIDRAWALFMVERSNLRPKVSRDITNKFIDLLDDLDDLQELEGNGMTVFFARLSKSHSTAKNSRRLENFVQRSSSRAKVDAMKAQIDARLSTEVRELRQEEEGNVAQIVRRITEIMGPRPMSQEPEPDSDHPASAAADQPSAAPPADADDLADTRSVHTVSSVVSDVTIVYEGQEPSILGGPGESRPIEIIYLDSALPGVPEDTEEYEEDFA